MKQQTQCDKAWPAHSEHALSHTVLRLLMGLALLCTTALPCLIFLVAISNGGHWAIWRDIIRELKSFFGNWTSVWLLLGFVMSLPLFGMYLIVEGVIRLKRHSRARRIITEKEP